LEEKIKPIIEELVYNLANKMPQDPIKYMIEWLQGKGGYTSNGLTAEEKSELEQLRRDIQVYRERDEGNDAQSNESDEDSVNAQEEKETENNILKRLSMGRGPRNEVSAEVYGMFNTQEKFVPKVVKKSDEQINRIKLRILPSFLFSSLDESDLQIIINAMTEKKFKEGESVITQGDKGDCLYIVDEGELDCYKKFNDNSSEQLIKTYQAGESFGELALLYNCPRAASVIAKSTSVLWELDRETFNHIVKDSTSKKRKKYQEFLKGVDILHSIDNYELAQICDALRVVSFEEGDFIVQEGEFGDVFYIIESGSASVYKTLEPGKQPTKVLDYKEGQYFGELALIKGEPRAASVKANSQIKLITLDRLSFKRLLGPIEKILERNSEKYVKYIKKQ